MPKTVFYEVNPRFFRDSNRDGIGDLPGLIAKFDYFSYLSVEVIILQGLVAPKKTAQKISFCALDNAIGTTSDLEVITNLAHNYGQKIMIELDLGLLYEHYHWFKDASTPSQTKRKPTPTASNREDQEGANFETTFTKIPSQDAASTWKKQVVMQQFLKTFRFWKQLGVNGFVFENFEYLADESATEVMNQQTLFELRKIYYFIKDLDPNFSVVARSALISFTQGEKYAHPQSKIFDYFMALKVPFLGISDQHGLNRRSQFRPKTYTSFLKTNYAQKNMNIIAFNAKTISKALSRWANDGEYIAESAKALALLLLINGASPLIYAGDEIGLPNIGGLTMMTTNDNDQFPTLSKANGSEAQTANNPFNARALMIWNDSKNGGFSAASETITPPSRVIPNVNVKVQHHDPTSVLSFYRDLIRLVRFSSFSDLLKEGIIKPSSLASSLIKYTITSPNNKLDVIINLSPNTKLNWTRYRDEVVIFSTYNRQYSQIPRSLDPYEGLVIASKQPQYVKSTTEIAIENIKKAKIERQVRHRAQIKAKIKYEHDQKILKAKQERMIAKKIKQAQTEEKAQLFKNHEVKKIDGFAKQMDDQELGAKKPLEENIMFKNKKSKSKKINPQVDDPFATNDLDLEDLKESAKMERQADQSHLDEATKLKEEELAKTTLLDENVDLDELFDHDPAKKK